MVAARLIKRAAFILIAWGCFVLAAEQFIVQKPKKTASLATLKEECCTQLIDAVKEIPALLAQVALFQKTAIDIVQGYWESDKESFCQKASKEKLERCTAELKQLHEKTDTLIAEYRKISAELKL